MKWEQFKNRFRKEAVQEQANVDPAAIWEAIEPQVDALNEKKPQRRRFGFWLFFAGLLLAGASWYLVTQVDYPKDVIVQNEKIEAIGNLTNDSAVEKEVDKTEALPKSETINTKENYTSKNTKGQSINKIAPKPTEFTSIADSKSMAKTTRRNIELRKEERTASFLNETIELIASPNELRASAAKSENPISYTIPLEKLNDLTEKTPKRISSFSTAISKNISPETNSIHKLNRPKIGEIGLLTSSSISPLAEFYPPLLRIKSTAQTTFNKELLNEISLAQKSKTKLRFLASIEQGVSLINRSVKAKDAAASQSTLLSNRETYETPLEAIHYGLSLGLAHRSGFKVSIGVQRTKIAERFDFNENLISIDSIMGVQSRVAIYPGDTIAVMGMIPRTTTIINQIKVYNAYTLMDVPVSIGYQYAFNERWNAGIEGSVLINLSLKTKGSIMDELKQEINIGRDQSQIFKSKVGLNYALGVSVGYALSDKIALNLSPFVRIFPGDFSVATYELSQKYTLVGGKLKLDFKF